MTVAMGRLAPLVFAAAAFCHPLCADAAVAPGSAAEIVSLQGSGEQRTGNAPDWHPARIAQALAAGDYVRTREASRMALLFADQTQVRLNQNTTLQVKGVAGAQQSATTLLLEAGRAWAQTRRPPGSPLNVQTPAGNAGIRGTDWEIQVDPDGKTLLTVLSGEVTLTNAQGQVTVASNEAAIAEVGKAPMKIQLSAPRDRIQWVNAMTPEPMRHLGSDAQAQGLREIARQIQAGDTAGAQKRLAALIPATGPGAYLMLGDLQTVQGENAAAIETLRSGLQRFPGNTALRAELARAQLLADRVDDSAATLAEARDADDAELWIARGALARRQGDSAGTIAAYSRAAALAPQDDRAWFGLGSAHTEREDSEPARSALTRALELNSRGAGYRGELGLLETFRNDLAGADQAFGQALADNPADYVALTGLGLLRLKQGQPDAALDAFLRAGVMEPRYARAKTYTAVAYWQLGRQDDAIKTLQQAATLDQKDPLPHLFLAQIYADLFRAGEAVEASRAAVQRLPYLKSLNQLASDQQGRANLGASLAFFGLEDWALEVAQQSYYPYWGASHLFLADRYPGEFNKNSELFQGYLADPLAFGGSNRFSSLLQRPGNYGTVGLQLEEDFYHASSPSVAFNGLHQGAFPVAYFVKAQNVVASRYPIDMGVMSQPLAYDPTGRADIRADVGTLGLGARPNANLGLFAYYNQVRLDIKGRNQVDVGVGDPWHTTADDTVKQAALGASYRWSPNSQTWLKLGYSEDLMQVGAWPTQFVYPPLAGTLGLNAVLTKRFTDAQLRHTADLNADTRLSLGLEHVKERQFNDAAAGGMISGDYSGISFADALVFGGVNRIEREYSALTLGGQRKLSATATVDGALTASRIRHDVTGYSMALLLLTQITKDQQARRDDNEHMLAPRLGLVLQPAPGVTLRAAYQDWVRPLSVGTLDSVQTAGIPVEDRLVEAGGRLKRKVVQLGTELGERTFLTARLDHMRVDNPVSQGIDLRTPSLPFLEELRNTQIFNISSREVLEDTPAVEHGTVRGASASVDHVLNRQFSAYAKYSFLDSENSFEDSNAASGRVEGKQIPFLPRHTAVLGATWASEHRLYFSGRFVYRSERFEDMANLTPRPAGWKLDLVAYWESADKHWIIGAGALNLLGPNSERQTHRAIIDARYRF